MTSQGDNADLIGNVKNILCESGFTFVWLQQETVNPKWLKGVLHKRLADINRQVWHLIKCSRII